MKVCSQVTFNNDHLQLNIGSDALKAKMLYDLKYKLFQELEDKIEVIETIYEYHRLDAKLIVFSNTEIKDINDYLKCLEGCGVDVVIDKIKQILNK